MQIVEIFSLSNGAHRNQTGEFKEIPNGWAVIPAGMVTENFPFGKLTAEEIDGIMTVTGWDPGVIPELEPVESEPTPQEDADAMLVDHEYRLTLLELGV